MTASEMKRALLAAEQSTFVPDNNPALFAKMLVGELRKLDANWRGKFLANLKRELREYNIITRELK